MLRRGDESRENLYSLIAKAIESNGGTVRLIAVLVALACLAGVLLSQQQIWDAAIGVYRWLAQK